MIQDTESQSTNDELLEQLRAKPDAAAFADAVLEHPEWISQLLAIIQTDRGSIKFLCDKIIRRVAEIQPALVYPYFFNIAELIDSPNNFIKWGAIITIGQLAAIDSASNFNRIYEKYVSLIDAESMITAGNAIGQVNRVLRSHPEYEPDLTQRLLRVSENTYWHKGQPSPECRNIVCGMVIDCFDAYFQISGQQREMLAFVEGQRQNTRRSVANKAAAFLKKHAA